MTIYRMDKKSLRTFRLNLFNKVNNNEKFVDGRSIDFFISTIFSTKKVDWLKKLDAVLNKISQLGTRLTKKNFNALYNEASSLTNQVFPFTDEVYQPINTSIIEVPVKMSSQSFKNVAEVIEMDLRNQPTKKVSDIEIMQRKIQPAVKQQLKKLLTKYGSYKVIFNLECIMHKQTDYDVDDEGNIFYKDHLLQLWIS